MLAELRDYLKTLDVASNYYIGKIDNSKMQTVGVYPMPQMRRVEAIGLDSSYDVAGFQILVHWNKNARETENASRNLYNKIRYITDTEMDTVYVHYIDLDSGEPTFIGTDDNGVYEYHIAGRIFYRR